MSAYLSVPTGVTPTPTSVSTSYTQRSAFGTTSTMYQGFLDPTDVPDIASISSSYEPYFSRSCTIPYGYRTTTGTGASPTATDSGDSSDYPYNSPSYPNYNEGDGNGCYNSYDEFYYSMTVTHYCQDGSRYVSLPAPQPREMHAWTHG